jgi:hypothetical protein
MLPEEKLPFRRLECSLGEEAQVDFGQGAWIEEQGRRYRPHVFRIVLSYSRKAYSEVVRRQTTEVFVGCLENAWVERVVLDNLRAAVRRADWYGPELNPQRSRSTAARPSPSSATAERPAHFQLREARRARHRPRSSAVQRPVRGGRYCGGQREQIANGLSEPMRQRRL